MANNRFVISKNERRNTCECVYHNEDDKGKKYSLTRHEVLDPSKPSRPFKRKAKKNVAGIQIEVPAKEKETANAS